MFARLAILLMLYLKRDQRIDNGDTGFIVVFTPVLFCVAGLVLFFQLPAFAKVEIGRETRTCKQWRARNLYFFDISPQIIKLQSESQSRVHLVPRQR